MDEEAQQALEEAIAENPEEVARFVRQVGLANELLGATRMAIEGADDHVVESVAGKAQILAESADGLAQDGTPELAGAIGANNEQFRSAVEKLARLEENGALDTLVEAGEALQMATEAADDHVVSSLAYKAQILAESADGLAQDGTSELADTIGANNGEFREAAEKLARLEENGTLDQLVEAGEAIKMATDAADDQVVTSLAKFAQFEVELLHTMADERIITGVETLTSAVGDVCQTCDEEDGLPPRAKLGMRALLFGGGPLKDPDVQRGLGYVFEILKALGQRLEQQQERVKQ